MLDGVLVNEERDGVVSLVGYDLFGRESVVGDRELGDVDKWGGVL